MGTNCPLHRAEPVAIAEACRMFVLSLRHVLLENRTGWLQHLPCPVHAHTHPPDSTCHFCTVSICVLFFANTFPKGPLGTAVYIRKNSYKRQSFCYPIPPFSHIVSPLSPRFFMIPSSYWARAPSGQWVAFHTQRCFWVRVRPWTWEALQSKCLSQKQNDCPFHTTSQNWSWPESDVIQPCPHHSQGYKDHHPGDHHPGTTTHETLRAHWVVLCCRLRLKLLSAT